MTVWFVHWSEREYAEATPSLALFRIVFAAMLLLFRLPLAPGLHRLPPEAFRPPDGLPLLWAGFPGELWYFASNGLLALLLVLLLVGWRTRVVSIALSALLLCIYSREYGTGKIDHDILLVMTPLLASLSSWGDRWSLDAARASERSPVQRAAAELWSARALALLAMTIGLSMCTSGILKVYSGWLAPGESATFGYAALIFLGGSEAPLTPWVFRALPGLAWEAMDWGAVALELGFGLAFLRRRVFVWFLAAAVLFHVGVILLLDITFFSNLIAYGAFVSWGLILPAAGSTTPSGPVRSRVLLLGVGAALAAGALAIFAETTLDKLTGSVARHALGFGPASLLAVGWMAWDGRRLAHSLRRRVA